MTFAKTVLPPEDEPFWRRWLLAAAAVILVHAAIILWILYIRDLRAGGEPPASIMIELAPLDVAPPTQSPAEITPGPQMTEAQPEEVEQQQTIRGRPNSRVTRGHLNQSIGSLASISSSKRP